MHKREKSIAYENNLTMIKITLENPAKSKTTKLHKWSIYTFFTDTQFKA